MDTQEGRPYDGQEDGEMGTTTDSDDDHEEQAEDDQFHVPGLEVRESGRLRIPHRLRDRFDIGEEDVLDLRVHAEGVRFTLLDAIVDDRGRVTIPRNKRRIYDVGEGDVVDLDVMVTGLNASDDN